MLGHVIRKNFNYLRKGYTRQISIIQEGVKYIRKCPKHVLNTLKKRGSVLITL